MSTAKTESSRSSRVTSLTEAPWTTAFLLAAATFALFLRVWRFDFIDFDDNLYVTRNYWVRPGLAWQGVATAFGLNIGHWHPLTWLSHMLDCQIYGLWAGGHHLTSLLLHVANTVLLFQLLLRATRSWGSSVFAAGLFALHPLHVEPVVWIASRKDVLSGFFWLLTLWAYVRYTQRPGMRRYAVTASCFLLAAMSKVMTMTLPLTLLFLDYWPLNRFGNRSQDADASGQTWGFLVLEKAPFFFVSFLLGCLSIYAAQEGGALRSTAEIPLTARLANAPVYLTEYCLKTVWPTGLVPNYPLPNTVLPAGQIAGSVVFLVGVSACAILLARRARYFIVGWLWFVLTLLPVIGIVQIGGHSLADRYTYVPLVGIGIMVAWGVPHLLQPWKHRSVALSLAGAATLMALAFASSLQINQWRHTTTLFEHMLRVYPNDANSHAAYGQALLNVGRSQEAIRELTEALCLNANHVEAHVNLGLALASLGRKEEAAAHYRTALSVESDNATALNNLGALLVEEGKAEEAMELYEAALRKWPDYPDALNNMGNALLVKQDPDRAIEYYSRALHLDPSRPSTLCNMGAAQLLKGDTEAAVETFERSLALDSNDATTHINLAVALDRLGRRDDAIRHAQEALRIEPGSEKARALITAWQAQLEDSTPAASDSRTR